MGLLRGLEDLLPPFNFRRTYRGLLPFCRQKIPLFSNLLTLNSPNLDSSPNIRVDVPGTQTHLILNLLAPVPVRDLDSLFQSAQGYAEIMFPEEASDNPWIHSIDLGIQIVVRQQPGQYLSWGVVYNALEGLEIYFIDPPGHGNFCKFRIFDLGMQVGEGVTEAVPRAPGTPPSPVGPPAGGGIATS